MRGRTTGVLVVTAALAGCGSASPAARPRATTIAGHYAELAGSGAGTVLLLPPGGWQGDGPGAVKLLRPTARRFAGLGWRTITLSYANGAAGLSTVKAAWRQARAAGPACVYGESSGGHWALTLAARDRGVRCVIAAAAPTELIDWPRELRNPEARAEAIRLRDAAFGDSPAAWRRASPALAWPAGNCARVLLLNATNDPIVPLAQADALRDRAGNATLVRLHAGTRPWVHSRVDAADLRAGWRAVGRLLRARPAACHA